MKYLIITFGFFLLVYYPAYAQNAISANVLSETALPGIASASGMESKNDHYFIVSDDAPWLYELDTNLQVVRKYLVYNHSFEGMHRVPGDVKPDFEAMVKYRWGRNDLLMFGSGSGPNRKTMVRVEFTGRGYDVREYTLEHLYNRIIEKGPISADQLNIEGAASWRDHLVLMNRETNHLILIRKQAFEQFMKMNEKKQANKDLKVLFYDFQLPEIDGVQAKFSGGMKVSGEEVLVFTAAVENRDDPAADGAILGSFVGLIPLNDLPARVNYTARVMKDGIPYTGKIESVDVEKVKKKSLLLNAVTDDDSGSSTFLRIELKR